MQSVKSGIPEPPNNNLMKNEVHLTYAESPQLPDMLPWRGHQN